MNLKFKVATLFICIGAILRLLPHPHNMTPIAAMALMGGLYIGRKYLAYIIPFVTLFFSDLILNNTINRIFFEGSEGIILWDDYMLYTYIAFGLTVVLGSLLKSTRGLKLIVSGTLLSSLLFFLITNLGTWMSGVIYPKDFAGLLACFVAAIPFFINTLIGNLVFIGVFVFGIELVNAKSPSFEKA